MEGQLNINNQNLKEYLETHMAARAQNRQAHSRYWPTLPLGPHGTDNRSPGLSARTHGGEPGGGTPI